MANTVNGREIGVVGFPANFEVKKAAPLDARQICATKEQKYELEYTFNGMLAVVTADPVDAENGLWICINAGAPTAANPGDALTGAADWEAVGGQGGGDPVAAFTYYDDQAAATAAGVNLNDLVIELESGATFTVNIQAGGTYQPNDYGIADGTLTPNAVGGIAAETDAADLEGLTFTEMWNKLLFPAVSPIIGSPSATVNNIGGLYEVGYEWNGNIDLAFSLGSVSSPWPSAPNQGTTSDGIDSATLTLLDGSQVDVKTGNASLDDPYAWNGNWQVILGANGNVQLDMTFLTGQQKVDSTGAAFGTPYAGGSDSDTASSFNGAWPIYLGTSSNGWEKVTAATENTGKQTGGGSTNILSTNPTSNFQFSQNYGDIDGGVRHRVAVHSTYITGNDFTVEERNFGAPQTGAGTWVSSTWVAGGTTTFNVNANYPAETYVIMEKSGTSSGGDESRSEIGGALMCKYRIAGA